MRYWPSVNISFYKKYNFVIELRQNSENEWAAFSSRGHNHAFGFTCVYLIPSTPKMNNHVGKNRELVSCFQIRPWVNSQIFDFWSVSLERDLVKNEIFQQVKELNMDIGRKELLGFYLSKHQSCLEIALPFHKIS